MIVNIDGPIETESLERLITAYNTQEAQGGIVNIYLSTGGGSLPAAQAMTDIINKNAHITTLTVYNSIMSCGLEILFKTICAKTILPTTYGMIHLHSWSTPIQTGGPATEESKFRCEVMKKSLKSFLVHLRELGLTTKEIEEVKKGKDVYIPHERLVSMVKNYKL